MSQYDVPQAIRVRLTAKQCTPLQGEAAHSVHTHTGPKAVRSLRREAEGLVGGGCGWQILGARLDEFAALPQRTAAGFAQLALLLRLLGTPAAAALPGERNAQPCSRPQRHSTAATD